MPKTTANILLTRVCCPECGFRMLDSVWDRTVRCMNAGCELYNTAFVLPEIRLKLVEKGTSEDNKR